MRRAAGRYGRRGAAAIALAALVLAGCGSGAGPAGSPATASRGGSNSASRSVPADPPADVDLTVLLRDVPEYRGQGRNLFDYGRIQASNPEPPPPPEPRAPVVAPPPPRPARPPAPRIDLKYAGYVEKTASGGEKKKYAIFLDGNDILTGAEGDRMSNRYTIVQIGLESVTVSVEGSGGTQRIPLRSQ